jgi:hypothetical protein
MFALDYCMVVWRDIDQSMVTLGFCMVSGSVGG